MDVGRLVETRAASLGNRDGGKMKRKKRNEIMEIKEWREEKGTNCLREDRYIDIAFLRFVSFFIVFRNS